jgi:hypothetical protein
MLILMTTTTRAVSPDPYDGVRRLDDPLPTGTVTGIVVLLSCEPANKNECSRCGSVKKRSMIILFDKEICLIKKSDLTVVIYPTQSHLFQVIEEYLIS